MAPFDQFLLLLGFLLISVVAENDTQEEHGTTVWSRFYKGHQTELMKGTSPAEGQPPIQPRELYQDYGFKEAAGVKDAKWIVGAIKVSNSQGNLGYVSKDFKYPGLYYTTTDPAKALVVLTYPATWPTQIMTQNGDDTFMFLGAVKGLYSTDANLQSGSSNYAFITATNITPIGSHPTFVGNSYTKAVWWEDYPAEVSQSGIWYLDPQTLEFSYTYVNEEGSANPTTLQLVYDPKVPDFTLTGDFEAYKSKFDGSPVSFSLDTSIHHVS